MVRRATRSFWSFDAREARAHAIAAAAALWVMAGVITFSGETYRSITGTLKGADFVHFYTFGHAAATGSFTILYDVDALHRRQIQLVPESDSERYLPVYPPHTALLFAPLSRVTYGTAALAWAAITITLYSMVVWVSWRRFRAVLTNKGLVIAAAVAFPPFWNLVLHGQTTIVPLVALFAGWLALEHRRPFWAGFAFGLLLIKPQFGLVLAFVVVGSRQWAVMAGAATSVTIQMAVTLFIMGSSVAGPYLDVLWRMPDYQALLEPRPGQMHSLSALANLLGVLGTPLWTLLTLAIAVVTLRVWRSPAPTATRMGVLVLATLLVNPHLTIYDVTVLALPLVWLGAWIESDAAIRAVTRRHFWTAVYWLYVTLLFPTARLVAVQASVLLMGFIFVAASRRAIRAAGVLGPSEGFAPPDAARAVPGAPSAVVGSITART